MVTDYLNRLEAGEDVSDMLEKASAERHANTPN